jgi:hypothetical protein
MADELVRVEIGFDGGLIASMKLSADQWASFEAALRAGSGTVELAADEATYFVDAAKVSYVRRESHVGRVGF